MRPRSVTAAVTRPPSVSIPRTAQPVKIPAPSRRAASAIAGAACAGSARPSVGVYIPPTNGRAAPGATAASSAPRRARTSIW